MVVSQNFLFLFAYEFEFGLVYYSFMHSEKSVTKYKCTIFSAKHKINLQMYDLALLDAQMFYCEKPL